MHEEITDLWFRYEDWLADNAPHLVDALRPGADDEDIEHAENVCGVRFPDDYRAFLRVHDGQNPDAGGMVPGGELLSLSRIEDDWDVWNDLHAAGEFAEMDSTPRGPVRPLWWNPQWIPFTANGEGDHDCLDLDPAPGGTAGQIVEVWHELDWRTVTFPTFTAWFADLVDGCEAGRYVYSAEDRAIVEDDGL